MIPLSNLSIAAAWRRGERDGHGGDKTERHFWDYVVHVISLRSTWQDADRFGVVADSVGVLGWGKAGIEAESVAKLRIDEQADYPPNRVAIYVCPECGDLGCGAVTVAVNRDAEAVTWSDFRWEVNWYADHPGESTIRFELGPFRFDYDAYSEVLNSALRLRPKAG